MEPEQDLTPAEAAEARPCLSNACDYSEANLAEAVRQRMKQTKKLQTWLLLGTIAALLVYSLVAWFLQRQSRNLIFAAISLLLLGLAGYVLFVLPGKAARNQAATIREKNGGLTFRSCFREEEIGFIRPDGEESSRIPYRALDKIVRSPKLLLLFTADKQMLLLDPDRFTNGTEADFWKLMNEKRPSAVPADRRA